MLVEDSKTLAEVVVIGYGTQRKSDLTGGLVSVDQKKLNMINSSNLMDRLAGQIPGLSITMVMRNRVQTKPSVYVVKTH